VAACLAGGVALGGAGFAASWKRAREHAVPPGSALQGRLGGHVSSFDRLYRPAGLAGPAVGAAPAPYRRVYDAVEGRLVLEVLADGQVRQITFGRERPVPDVWEPAPDDWSLAQARELARRWLPPDAALLRAEPFFFQGRAAGLREVYHSQALAPAAGLQGAAAAGVAGAGNCAATYYQTSAGGVAFVLIGLY
jgi:hypothetical protein